MSDPFADVEVAPGATLRPTARVLLVDHDDRLLLFRYTATDGSTFWCPTGGGVDPGETVEATARREVVEETGFTGPLELLDVARRRHVVHAAGTLFDVREHWFLARVPPFELDGGGWTTLEHDTIVEHRWWPVEELPTAIDRMVPADLAAVMARLLADGAPPAPLLLGT